LKSSDFDLGRNAVFYRWNLWSNGIWSTVLTTDGSRRAIGYTGEGQELGHRNEMPLQGTSKLIKDTVAVFRPSVGDPD
jgi:hypothetical protein